MDDEKFNVYYRKSIATEPELVVENVSYEDAQDLCLFFSHTIECYSEKNYQGIPVQIGVYFEEAV